MSETEAGATILIVDDTPTNLAVAVDLLEEHGLRVVVAQDGKEGLRRAAFSSPDLILLDVMLPDMSGFEVCRELKSKISTRDIPVIFMTALTDTASKLEGFEAGGVDYITKPLSIEEMLARVMAHVTLRMTQIELNRKNQKLQSEAAVRQQAESTLQDAYAELKSAYKRLEHAKIQLLSDAKIISIGMLSNGVARQVAQPVGALREKLGKLEACIKPESGASAAGEAAQRMLRLIGETRNELTQTEEVVRTLQDLAAPGERAWRAAGVNQLLDNIVDILSDEIGAKASIVKNYADVPEIVCRPIELMQVFMNMLLNASQAILEKGEIHIATGCNEREIWVDIADTGVGIEPANLARVFDPFFSTKPSGKGAGLGLSFSFAAIKKHHGRIEVTSVPGEGSTFRLWLPLQQP